MNSRLSHFGTCCLCQNDDVLQISHSIPDAVFRRLFSKGSGSAIVLNNKTDDQIHKSQDSWGARLLCQKCERDLNFCFDVFGDKFSKGMDGLIRHEAGFSCISLIDQRLLRMFFLSVVWRMHHSTAIPYLDINIPSFVENQLRDCLLQRKSLPQNLATVRLFRLRDKSKINGFSDDHLESFIASPWSRFNEKKKYFVEYIFSGYFVSVELLGSAVKERRKIGVLSEGVGPMMIPHKEPIAIPQVMDTLLHAMDKTEKGLVAKSVKKYLVGQKK